MDLFKRLFGKKEDAPPPDDAERLWQSVYDTRARFFETHFGTLPDDILKLGDLLGLWPGGGLYAIPAERLGPGLAVYTSFGLSNPDMPTQGTVSDVKTERDGDRIVRTEGVMKPRDTPRPPTGRPGYGYEIMVIAEANAEWPLWLLQWAVKAEMLHDADFVGRVEKYAGMTVEDVGIGPGRSVNLFIAKAQPPLPTTIPLPTGSVDLLVMTVVTEAEMRWSLQHGRDQLLQALLGSEIGQRSILDRNSVVSLTGPVGDFSEVRSRDDALALAAQGKLFKILLFPEEFGGEDIAPNAAYVPAGIPEIKQQLTNSLIRSAQDGHIDRLEVAPEYKGESFVPARLRLTASHSETGNSFEQVIEIW